MRNVAGKPRCLPLTSTLFALFKEKTTGGKRHPATLGEAGSGVFKTAEARSDGTSPRRHPRTKSLWIRLGRERRGGDVVLRGKRENEEEMKAS